MVRCQQSAILALSLVAFLLAGDLLSSARNSDQFSVFIGDFISINVTIVPKNEDQHCSFSPLYPSAHLTYIFNKNRLLEFFPTFLVWQQRFGVFDANKAMLNLNLNLFSDTDPGSALSSVVIILAIT